MQFVLFNSDTGEIRLVEDKEMIIPIRFIDSIIIMNELMSKYDIIGREVLDV